MAVKGTIGKCAIVSADAQPNLLATATTVIIRLRQSGPITEPEYLFRYLTQPVVTNYLESLAGGTAISFMKARDLEKLQVPIPSREKEREVLDQHLAILERHEEATRLLEEAHALNAQIFSD